MTWRSQEPYLEPQPVDKFSLARTVNGQSLHFRLAYSQNLLISEINQNSKHKHNCRLNHNRRRSHFYCLLYFTTKVSIPLLVKRSASYLCLYGAYVNIANDIEAPINESQHRGSVCFSAFFIWALCSISVASVLDSLLILGLYSLPGSMCFETKLRPHIDFLSFSTL